MLGSVPKRHCFLARNRKGEFAVLGLPHAHLIVSNCLLLMTLPILFTALQVSFQSSRSEYQHNGEVDIYAHKATTRLTPSVRTQSVTASRHPLFELAYSAIDIKARLAGVPVYTVAKRDNSEFVLVSGEVSHLFLFELLLVSNKNSWTKNGCHASTPLSNVRSDRSLA